MESLDLYVNSNKSKYCLYLCVWPPPSLWWFHQQLPLSELYRGFTSVPITDKQSQLVQHLSPHRYSKTSPHTHTWLTGIFLLKSNIFLPSAFLICFLINDLENILLFYTSFFIFHVNYIKKKESKRKCSRKSQEGITSSQVIYGAVLFSMQKCLNLIYKHYTYWMYIAKKRPLYEMQQVSRAAAPIPGPQSINSHQKRDQFYKRRLACPHVLE